MLSFTELGNRFARVSKDRILSEMVKANEDLLVFKNQSQLLKGEKKDGVKIGTYLPYTVMKRIEKGRQTQFIDLFYEGNFQDGMFLEVRGMDYLIWSKDWKTDMLVDRYGETIFGLSQENKREFMTEKGISFIARSISKITGLKVKAA